MIDSLILQAGSDWRAQAEVFEEIFFVFLALGTLVGIIVVSYTLWNAYKYRDDGGEPKDDFDAPTVGELPTGQGGPKAKKLFLSFGLSAIVVISLVVYAYGLLLYVEEGPQTEMEGDAAMEIEVEGYQFGWDYIYPNGYEQGDALRVPAETRIDLAVTSTDVWHNFGSSDLRIKSDAIPGEYSHVWFSAEPGEYTVECFELCGAGHSQMTDTIIVMPEDDFQDWYEDTGSEGNGSTANGTAENGTAGNDTAENASAGSIDPEPVAVAGGEN